MVSISSRSDGTSSRSTCEKMRAISCATLRRKPVGLHEIHRREEARLAEEVGPRVGHLHLQLIDPAAQREFLEGGGRLRRTESS